MKWLAKFLNRFAGMVSLIGTVVGVGCTFYSVQLYKNLRPDMEELLPTSSRSVRDLTEVTKRLEAIENIVILIFSKDKDASFRFVNDLATRLNKIDKKLVSSVEYKITDELEFFTKRKVLFIDKEDLLKIRKYISDRIAYERSLYNPYNIISGDELKEPKLDYAKLQKKYQSKTSGYDHFPKGYYATEDEKLRVITVYMNGRGLPQAQSMKAELEKAIKEIDPKKYAPDLEVKFTGNIQNLLEESAALLEDLELSTLIVTVIVAVAMLLFYRSVLATFALVFSLFMGTLWTFGVAYFAVGYLNANTAFLASIVIGNGINYGIILLARYVEERRKGKEHLDSLSISMSETVTSTLTAALAAALSYGSLMLTQFRGFNQFGIIGFIGMILCWISSYTLLPAYLTLIDRWFRVVWTTSKRASSNLNLSSFAAWLVSKCSVAVFSFSIVAILFSISLFPNVKKGIIEMDLTKLRDKRSMQSGSGSLYHYIDDVFKKSFSPTVILPHSEADAERIVEKLKAKINTEAGIEAGLTSVQTVYDFVPKEQNEKVRILNEIRALLPAKLFSRLPDREKKIVTELLDPAGMKPFTVKDLPPLILAKFTERDKSFGKMILVDKQIEEVDNADKMIRFVALSRSTADEVSEGNPVAGGLPITADMFEAIQKDGPNATLFALTAVVLLVIVLFRDLITSLQILSSLFAGVILLAGLILGLELKINFLNFIALPITFGIGVDYGVNIFQRYREEGRQNIAQVVRHTGGAVMLASFTTMIGYASLLIAGNQAFVSFGQIAVLGEITCVATAVVSLPAFLSFLEKRKKSRISKEGTVK